MKILLSLTTAFLLFSCTRSVQYVSAFSTDNDDREVATIYFVNTSEDPGWMKAKVFVNSWLIGLMGTDGYLKAEVLLSETREVTLRSEISGETSLPFTISPGDTYYVELSIQVGPLQTRPLLKPLSKDAGRALVAQMDSPKEKVVR